MKRMITGVRPTGNITLANYIGSIKKFVELQNGFESLIFIADIHGVTTYIEPEVLRNNILDITAMYLACGVSDKVALFMQSDVLEHCNLGYLMAFQCSVGELARMTQYKAKRKELSKSDKDMGLFIYPTLMAADILLYDAAVVPVGEDQRQHIEKTRDLGIRFNKVYGDTFVLPEYQIPKIGAKIMNLQRPDEKMSKSAPLDDKGTIFMLDDEVSIRKKIMSAVTDNEGKVYFDSDKKPGISNLLSIVAVIQNKTIEEVVASYQDSSYKDFKMSVCNIVVDFILGVQEKFYKYRNDYDYLIRVLDKGAEKAREIASLKNIEVRNKVGLYVKGEEYGNKRNIK